LSKTVFVEVGNAWYMTGEFQIDEPAGLGGGSGYSDPTFAYSGNRILGSDLTGLGYHRGDYENSIGFNEEYAQSPMINCTNYNNTILRFYRYLGIDSYQYDDVSIEIITADSTKTVWTNTNNSITDTVWTEQIIDISDIADYNKIIIRFITGPTDHAEQYCGWNIDDVMVTGIYELKDTVISENFNLYPNPTRHYFYIEINDIIEGDAVVTISDISGKTIYNKRFTSEDIKIVDADHYRNLLLIRPETTLTGIYIVNIKTNSGSYSKKIVFM